METVTRKYRKGQIDRLPTKYSEYKAKIKITKQDGETNWLDIDEDELQKIIAVLVCEG